MIRKIAVTLAGVLLAVIWECPADELSVREIEREIDRAVADSERLQEVLSDRVLLTDYSAHCAERGGTNFWTCALQKAVDEHAVVCIPASDDPYYIDATVVIPSNRRIEATGATIRLADRMKTILLRNVHTPDGTLVPIPSDGRDDNIAIVGGRWEDNCTARAGYGKSGTYDSGSREVGRHYGVSTLFYFGNVNHLTVRDATFSRCGGFAVQVGDADAVCLERIRFDRCFADGLHLNGNVSRVLARNVRGQVGDDLVALNAYDWLNSSVNFGPQRLIRCEDLVLEELPGVRTCPSIRIQPAKYRFADGSVVNCSISDVIFRRVKGVFNYKMYLQTPAYKVGGKREWAEVGSGGNLHFEDLEIDLKRPIDMLGGYKASDPLRGHFAAFEFGANLSSLHFKNIDVAFHLDEWPLSHLVTVGPKSCRDWGTPDDPLEIFDPYVSCEVGKVVLENVRVRGNAPAELVRATVFDDVNRDGASSGRGVIRELVNAPGAKWIWYPGDFETYHAQQVQSRRLEWGGYTPVMWPQYTAYPVVEFYKDFDLGEEDEVEIVADGEGTVLLADRAPYSLIKGRGHCRLPRGKSRLSVKLQNHERFPCLWVRGRKVASDESWMVDWGDGQPVSAGCGYAFDAPQDPPTGWRLPTRMVRPESTRSTGTNAVFADFGKEIFGFPVLKGVRGSGRVKIVYGDSEAEALSEKKADVWELVDVRSEGDVRLKESRGFRCIQVIPQDLTVSVGGVEVDFEYLPVAERGRFRCDDEKVNRIWDVAAYTFRLCSREFLLDGLKRDRWLWSGDAYQSYLMNYYLFADGDSVKRTLWALRGKDPVVRHVNTIVDYTFYWFMGIGDYYLHTGDADFVKAIWPRMVSMMDFCLRRSRPDGFYEFRPGDWVFVDWAPEELDNNDGPVAVEQMLFVRSLEAMSDCARVVGDSRAEVFYREKAQSLRAAVVPTFYDGDRGVFVHSTDRQLKKKDAVTKYANIFGYLYDYLDESRRETAISAGVVNDRLMRIQTPYMRFYELEALCASGRQNGVLEEVRAYWGGMLDQGATSFWELYTPGETGADVYAMYGRPFGRSFCHAWGASPIYLLGRYYLGVRPTASGFAEYRVSPCPGGLKWMEGSVPTPLGDIEVSVSEKHVRVRGNGGEGTLTWNGKSMRIPPNAVVEVDR